ncbi:hypothetical protein CF65_00623 [Aggregatibacter actinomycetemcomitans HK1651]|nr:hypothetical protein CF65_00623 [Aggregatibacter actinomycetemcomitans HK1651]
MFSFEIKNYGDQKNAVRKTLEFLTALLAFRVK